MVNSLVFQILIKVQYQAVSICLSKYYSSINLRDFKKRTQDTSDCTCLSSLLNRFHTGLVSVSRQSS